MNGIADIIRIPIGWILQMCYKLTDNYMVALLLFALVMQIILLPFAIKQQKNSINQAKLAPKIAAIRKKYQGRNDQATQQKMQQETMDLYQRENYNPMGGCLPMLIQLPILFALFRVITMPLRYLCGISQDSVNMLLQKAELVDAAGKTIEQGVLYPQITLIQRLRDMGEAAATAFAEGVEGFSYAALPNFTFFGGKIDLSLAPKDAGIWSWMMLIPVITVAAMIISQMITRKFTYQAPETKEAQNNMSMKIMLYGMPFLSGYFAYLYAAAIGIYWIFRNILSFLQQILLAKLMPIPRFSEEDYKAAEKEILGSKAKKKSNTAHDPSKPKARSLHHIDDDDDDYVSDGKVTKYDEESEKDSSSSTLNGAPSSAVAAPMKDDKGTKFKKK
ncbi:MAG: YidC/Oxa1 family membrane protein insertase [Ruminococcaceae bacterium]|nr:YidC/Oxa1 family membrane protein insertase [Oscillospiraceae bacterium]